jgi:GNAT superfamily N-acetyltransferase
MNVEIRTFQPGDEATQAAIFNAAAAPLPGFKPATSEDIRRRTRASDFDAATRFYALAGGEVVGYCTIQANGRIGYPWCLPGHAVEEPLLQAALDACRARGIKRLFTAYRGDWPAPAAFFEAHGFHKSREIVNFTQNLLNLPTLVIRRGLNMSPLTAADVPAIAAMAPNLIRLPTELLTDYFFANPYFPPESLFVLRRPDGTPHGVGLLISNPEYANVMKIDAAAPCFRLGAFGTEGMTTKRVNGLFSFLVRDDAETIPVGLDMVSYALNHLRDDTIEALAAQVPSDAKHVLDFYQKFFRKQGSFPVYERELG